MDKLPTLAHTHLPPSLGTGTAVDAVSSSLDGISSWLKEREKRIEAEARLGTEVKAQREQTIRYAKKLKADLKALEKKCRANETYLKEQRRDRDKARQEISTHAHEMNQMAREIINSLVRQDLSEIPPETIESMTSAAVIALQQAAKMVDRFPSGPLAILD